MFKGKNKNEILEFFKDANYTIRNFSKGDIIAMEGSSCNTIGLVLAGNIDIKRLLTNKVIHVSSFTSGNLFGEVIAFSDTNVYPATVISSTNSEIMFIKKEDFIKFCTSHDDFLGMFLKELTNKIFILNRSITGLSFSTIRQKLSNFILEEYKLYGSKFIRLNSTKEKLAESLGIPRPSLSRELINMKDLGIIDYSRDFIKILDLDELEKILTD
ncbi:Crp/Fnr family transcriptional regulator [Asaccharospora irregularis]|uniref:cAMP-binding domain of CRP or a regulatory subunit of cAMP-dependent protein kinases n=1 Tax=Asaccharospora irregularis DSM 2635 TaxID=1121321 RepID=A0A1M5KM07_9FIRM|nr:Crp/Fnr family transcriptional regulator [Asaccharospora irregularis]SHG53791.1 cAMP-binding domain of CRP or a regulatory subunit of cAMP-dependent protein kinases [Asaccharospora irregularis DSM 2635]